METRNKSENLFEQYLNGNGFRDRWTYEKEIQGKNKNPDYSLDHCGQTYFFEVKELRKKDNEPTTRAAHIDPYASLRKEIDEANVFRFDPVSPRKNVESDRTYKRSAGVLKLMCLSD